MKAAATALMMLAALSAPAFAGPCDQDLKALDEALAKETVQPDVKAQVADMRGQAEKLCAAGNEEEAADVISEATSMLAGTAQ